MTLQNALYGMGGNTKQDPFAIQILPFSRNVQQRKSGDFATHAAEVYIKWYKENALSSNPNIKTVFIPSVVSQLQSYVNASGTLSLRVN